MNERPLRILIADDDDAVREALADLIRREDLLELAGAARDADEAVEMAREADPDVAVLDVKMPGGGGIAAAVGIRASSPRTRIVALSAWDDASTAAEMRRAGAAAYVLKGTSTEDLLTEIRRPGTEA